MGTLTYLARRLLLAVPTLLGITIVVFGIISLAPGDPAQVQASEILDPEISERLIREMRERFRLDEPLPKRYALWLADLARGDMGRSMADNKPVFDKIKAAFWPTVLPNVFGLCIALIVAVPIGIYSAWRQDGLFDRASGVILYGLYSIPSYVGAILLILVVSVHLDLLPFRGMRSDEYHQLGTLGRLGDLIAHGTLLVICSAYNSLAFYARFVRSNLLEVTRQDFIRTAQAKGLPPARVVLLHAFRNTLIPFVTLIGLVIPVLLSGSVILEVIFTWPGLGRLFFTALLQRDYTVIMALSTATAVLVLLGTLLADLLYGIVDPRVTHA